MAFIISAVTSCAQKESFDLVSFTRPKGWKRFDSNGTVVIADAKQLNGKTSFCQFLLYPSQPASNDATKNFQDEWANRVMSVNNVTVTPQPQIEKTSDGWSVASGQTKIDLGVLNFTCMLVAITGYGKEMSFVVNVTGQEYADDVKVFFENLDMRKPEIIGSVWNGKDEPPQSNTSGPLDYIYSIPAGWTPQKYSDGGVIITSPVYGTGEKCTISILPLQQVTTDLPTTATAIFTQMFSQNYQYVTTYTSPSVIRGISPQGWEYFIIKQGMKPRAGNYSDVFAFVFVAKLGTQLASIVGISKDPLVSNCFGLNLKDVWPKFFYSLQFKNWDSQGQNKDVMKRMAGVWMSASATAGDRIVFAPNGRYAGASAAQRYYATSNNELLTVTDAYFGDGGYSLNGNQITLTHDNDKNKIDKGFIRIEQESMDGGRTWKDKLYLLRTSIVDGSEYEVVYEKQ